MERPYTRPDVPAPDVPWGGLHREASTMQVKGIAFLARQTMMTAEHGEARWREYLTQYAERVPFFQTPVLPITPIPADAFVALNDDIVKTFYRGDAGIYWHFGERSGHQALTAGQLRGAFQPGEYLRFLLFTPRIWKGYFDGGNLEATRAEGHVDVHLTGVPTPHRYYEDSVMGFAAGGMKVLGAKEPRFDVLKSFHRKDAEVLYRFHLPAAA
jgi:hypothetical protein